MSGLLFPRYIRSIASPSQGFMASRRSALPLQISHELLFPFELRIPPFSPANLTIPLESFTQTHIPSTVQVYLLLFSTFTHSRYNTRIRREREAA